MRRASKKCHLLLPETTLFGFGESLKLFKVLGCLLDLGVLRGSHLRHADSLSELLILQHTKDVDTHS